jgi:hypothetical protein
MTRSFSALVLALAGSATALTGCTATPESPYDHSDDHGHDATFSLTDAGELEAELTLSPAHDAEIDIARISVLHRSSDRLPIEIATSADGLTWSDYEPGVLSEEASDEEFGVWVVDLDVIEGDARYWRVRSEDRSVPTELAVLPVDADQLADDLESEEDVPELDIAIEGEDLAVIGQNATTFRRYRFDLGRVGRSWLWLLRNARSRGWRGTLYGSRTGLRTYAQQNSLWRAYQNGTGAPAFPPWGPSRHLVRNVQRRGTWYQAVDTNDVSTLIRVARRINPAGSAGGVSLHVPYSNEPWHVEARRSFGPSRSWRP